MCGKFHTPLRMVPVGVIISCQKCDFSLKYINDMGARQNYKKYCGFLKSLQYCYLENEKENGKWRNKNNKQ